MPNNNELRALRDALDAVAKATPGPWFPDAYGDIFGGNDGDTPVCTDLYDRDTLAIVAVMNWMRDHGPALLASLAGEGWQPIETAPKDGTSILVARCGEDIGFEAIEITQWCVIEKWRWEEAGPDLFRKVREGTDEFWNGNGHRATHWMPRPDPPALHTPQEPNNGTR